MSNATSCVQVDGAISASERALEQYVGAFVERQLAAAKDQITQYADM